MLKDLTPQPADKIMELRDNNETHKYMLMRGRYSYMRDIIYDRMTKIRREELTEFFGHVFPPTEKRPEQEAAQSVSATPPAD